MRRMIILAEGRFGPLESKTANQAIRYIPEQVVGVIDHRTAGKTAQDVLGFGGSIPVFPTLESCLHRTPNTLLIGIAPTGGRLPEPWRATIHDAIDAGLNIISGLHTLLGDDIEIEAHARRRGVTIVDLRRVPPEYEVVAKGCWRNRRAKTILTVGTDCNVGKMTASLELHREFLRRGVSSEFIATGQTGMLLSGNGVAVDSVVSDYIAGAIETEIEKSVARGFEYLHVEGQGSLTHQGYSGVTLGLMHGVMPDALVLVHQPARTVDDYGFRIDDLRTQIELHESVLAPFRESKVVAIAINTLGLSSNVIEQTRQRLEAETGLPAGNVLTSDVERLADAIMHYVSEKVSTVLR
jgi:uncharacterized NAD-dependent epimerase/dehydratase family protein